MYAFESSSARAGLHVVVIGTLVAAVGLFSVGSLPEVPLPALFQLGGIGLFVAAVYLIARYSLRVYRYAIEPSGIVDAGGVEQYDLVITELLGKKQKVVARVGLRDIGEVVTVRRRDRESRSAIRKNLCRDKRIFAYANTPVIPHECYITLPDETAVLIIPTDERMVRLLQQSRGR